MRRILEKIVEIKTIVVLWLVCAFFQGIQLYLFWIKLDSEGANLFANIHSAILLLAVICSVVFFVKTITDKNTTGKEKIHSIGLVIIVYIAQNIVLSLVFKSVIDNGLNNM